MNPLGDAIVSNLDENVVTEMLYIFVDGVAGIVFPPNDRRLNTMVGKHSIEMNTKISLKRRDN